MAEMDQAHVAAVVVDANCPEDWIEEDRWRAWPPPLDIIAGEWVHVDFLRELCGPPRPGRRIVPVPVTLRREPTNEKDANAIAAEVERHHVGYMTAPLAARIAPAMDGLGLVSITVAALGARRTGRGSPAGSSGQ